MASTNEMRVVAFNEEIIDSDYGSESTTNEDTTNVTSANERGVVPFNEEIGDSDYSSEITLDEELQRNEEDGEEDGEKVSLELISDKVVDLMMSSGEVPEKYIPGVRSMQEGF